MAKICRRTGKISHRSEGAARAALRSMQSGALSEFRRREGKVEVAYYSCPHCPYWHLTSMRQS